MNRNNGNSHTKEGFTFLALRKQDRIVVEYREGELNGDHRPDNLIMPYGRTNARPTLIAVARHKRTVGAWIRNNLGVEERNVKWRIPTRGPHSN